MEKIAVFPGSFDPFTIGHESVINRALSLFDRIIIMIGVNNTKRYLFSIENRKRMIEDLFSTEVKIEVQIYNGLTVDFCKEIGATHILRGLRTSADFEYERAIAQVNKKMLPAIETVFFLTLPEHTPINSSVVRDIITHHGDVSMFVPEKLDLKKYFKNENVE
ncbi:MAG TPA: pantetheine-phosphate adenylyltransferase [Prolixibacteraceae bacterium]|nr:pantetheine-phosphate adenylyltransferase [Prolixibacteraceae bacterium]